MRRIRVLLANQNTFFRRGVRSMLLEEHFIEVIGETNGKKPIFDSTNKLRPDFLIIASEGSFQDSRQFQRAFYSSFPGVKVIYFIDTSNIKLARKILSLGVHGYLSISDSKVELINAINDIRSGRSYVSPSLSDSIIKSMTKPKSIPGSFLADLTKREKEVLKLISNGYMTREIADTLFISKYTVETHRKHLLQKINVPNTAALVKYAMENELVN